MKHNLPERWDSQTRTTVKENDGLFLMSRFNIAAYRLLIFLVWLVDEVASIFAWSIHRIYTPQLEVSKAQIAAENKGNGHGDNYHDKEQPNR